MSMIGSLLGRRTVLEYEILFDDKDLVSVNTNSPTTPIKLEYCKLCFLYLSKIIYNFGGKSATGSTVLLEAIRKIGMKGIKPNVDCFKLADLDDVIKYSTKLGEIITKLSGTFYAWNNGNRTIDTKFPLNTTEQQTVYGCLALLQFAIDENKNNEENLKFIGRVISQISFMYLRFDGSNINDVIGIPNAVFKELEDKQTT